jgi:hypothetical protein
MSPVTTSGGPFAAPGKFAATHSRATSFDRSAAAASSHSVIDTTVDSPLATS